MSTFDTVIADITKAAEIAAPVLKFAAIALQATGAGAIAVEAVGIIQAAAKVIGEHKAGNLTGDEAKAHLDAILAGLADNTTSAREVIDAAERAMLARLP